MSGLNTIFQFLQERLGENYKTDTLILLITFQGFLVFAFVITAFVVAGTANAGFNCVLTAFLNLAITLGGYYVIKHSQAPIAYGFLIGSSLMMIVLNLMNTIYWGKLSYCTEFPVSIPHYSCHQKSAYVAVSVFSALLVICQGLFTGLVYLWRGEFIENYHYPNDQSSNFSLPYRHNDTPYSINRTAYTPIHSTEL